MRIVITGGHFSPAHAIIKKLGHEELMVIGRRYAFEGDENETYEYKVCKQENIPFSIINAGRLQRKFTLHTIPSIVRFPKSIWEAHKILRKFKPDVVATFGGYVGLPVVIAASILKVPVVLHEQTQKAGLSSKAISRLSSVVCISFESSRELFPNNNVVLTGNPLREEIFKKHPLPFQPKKPLIYITGGSTGSHAINEAVYQILPQLLSRFTVVHQTGSAKEFGDFEKLVKFKESLREDLKRNYIPGEFFSPDEAMAYMQNASLVVSRSGINTVLELMAAGSVAVLIPLPFGQRNEQKDNALLFEKTGLGKMLEQKDVSPQKLSSMIHDMIEERDKYSENKRNAAQFIHRDAAEKIIEQIYLYGRKPKERRTATEEKKSVPV